MRERWRSSHLRPSWGFPRCTRKDTKFHQSSRPQHRENRAKPSMEFWLQREAPCNFRENNGGARDQLLISISGLLSSSRLKTRRNYGLMVHTRWLRLKITEKLRKRGHGQKWPLIKSCSWIHREEITGILLIKCKLETTIPSRLLIW